MRLRSLGRRGRKTFPPVQMLGRLAPRSSDKITTTSDFHATINDPFYYFDLAHPAP